MENIELEEVKEKAAELDAEGGGLMEPTPPKKGRGRPKKEKSEFSGKKTNPKKENPEKSDQDESQKADAIKPMIRHSILPMISSAAVDYAGDPRAAMHPAEMDTVTNLMCALLDKYAPNALGRFGLEITTVVVIGQYAYRVHKMRQLTLVESQVARQGSAAPGAHHAHHAHHAQAAEPEPDVQPKFGIVEKDVDRGEFGPHA